MKYKSGSSTKHRILIHLVFCPKYRRRVLKGKISIRIKQLFTQACEINDWSIEEYPELEEFLWGNSFWSDGYFAESIGSKNEEIMRNYIKNQ